MALATKKHHAGLLFVDRGETPYPNCGVVCCRSYD